MRKPLVGKIVHGSTLLSPMIEQWTRTAINPIAVCLDCTCQLIRIDGCPCLSCLKKRLDRAGLSTKFISDTTENDFWRKTSP